MFTAGQVLVDDLAPRCCYQSRASECMANTAHGRRLVEAVRRHGRSQCSWRSSAVVWSNGLRLRTGRAAALWTRWSEWCERWAWVVESRWGRRYSPVGWWWKLQAAPHVVVNVASDLLQSSALVEAAASDFSYMVLHLTAPGQQALADYALHLLAGPCASISLHGWGGHTGQSTPTTVLSFTFILRNGVRSHSRCGTESWTELELAFHLTVTFLVRLQGPNDSLH